MIICQIDWREVGVAFELQCLRNCTLSSFDFILNFIKAARRMSAGLYVLLPFCTSCTVLYYPRRGISQANTAPDEDAPSKV